VTGIEIEIEIEIDLTKTDAMYDTWPFDECLYREGEGRGRFIIIIIAFFVHLIFLCYRTKSLLIGNERWPEELIHSSNKCLPSNPPALGLWDRCRFVFFVKNKFRELCRRNDALDPRYFVSPVIVWSQVDWSHLDGTCSLYWKQLWRCFSFLFKPFESMFPSHLSILYSQYLATFSSVSSW